MTAQWVDALAKAAAAMGALAFFFWKLSRGYHVVDLKLSLELSRTFISKQEDCICILLKLAKGANGSIAIHDISSRTTWADKSITKPFAGISRLSFVGNDSPDGRLRLIWDKNSVSSPYLNLAPGDESEFSCFVLIPKEAICSIEAAVIGIKTGTKWKCQWRASRISYPRLDQKE